MTMTATVPPNTVPQNGAATQIAPRGAASPAIITEEHRQILRGMIDRNATNAQVEMLIVVGNRYNLDPLMGHVVLINGKCFVTHKGLMHVAHVSGRFDGIETNYGVDELGEFCECSVFRKDMTRPFSGKIYIDEYRSAGPVWKQYPRAMAAKTAESFVLRRAFDVALTSQEEIDVADSPPPQRVFSPEEKAERKALSERIGGATKALTEEQFSSFKAKVAECGGIGAMETADLRDLLSQVEEVALCNAAKAERAAKLTAPAASAEQTPGPADDAEDDPFADDGVAGPEGG